MGLEIRLGGYSCNRKPLQLSVGRSGWGGIVLAHFHIFVWGCRLCQTLFPAWVWNVPIDIKECCGFFNVSMTSSFDLSEKSSESNML